MKDRVIAKRYGSALFDLAISGGDSGRLSKNVLLLRSVVNKLPSFVRALSYARVSAARRMAAVDAVAKELNFCKESASFLKLLIEKRRVDLLGLILDDFSARLDRSQNLSVCEAFVADEGIADEVKKRIEEIIGAALGAKARCDVDVSAELIGGFVLAIGDARYDASVKGKLERMRETLWKSA